MKRNLTIFLSLFVIAFVAGCGDPKVTGTVTFPDGTPLTKGMVMFQKEGFIGSGNVRSDGTYSAGKLRDGDGLPPGIYQVFLAETSVFDPAEIARIQEMQAAAGGAPVFAVAGSIDLVAHRYLSPGTSNLTVEVTGNTRFDITVEAPN